MAEKSNVIPIPQVEHEEPTAKSHRRSEVKANNADLDRLSQSGRYYVTPADRVHMRIPPMLHIRVGTTGPKAFAISLRIRDQKTRKPAKRRDVTLGRYPALSLADAIQRGWELVMAADRGEDPNATRDEYRRLADAVPTFDVLLGEYEVARAGELKTVGETVKTIRRALPNGVRSQSAALVNGADVVRALKTKARSGHPHTAVRTRSYIASFLRWANNTYDYEIEDWVEGYRPSAPKSVRERVLSWEEMDMILSAADKHLAEYWRNLLWVLVLTGVRRDEAANAKWSEIDLVNGTWTIPAERLKMGREHVVPLTPRMIEAFEAQKDWQRVCKMKTPWVFTSNGNAPVQGHSKMKARLDRFCDVEAWVFHDFRRTISTRLVDDLDEDGGLADLILAHSRRGTERHYNKATRLDARRRAHLKYEAAVMGTGPRKIAECSAPGSSG